MCCMYCFLLVVAYLPVGAAGRVLHVLFPSSCGMSFCRDCGACVACSISFFLWHVLLSELRGLCCIFCFLLLVACLAVGTAGRVLHVVFPSSCGMSCCRDCGACVACSVSSFLWHVLLSGLRGVCCMFCFLLLVACLAVRTAGRVLHVLFPSSCGMSCCWGCRACAACSVSFFLWHVLLSWLQGLFPGLWLRYFFWRNERIFLRSPFWVFVCVSPPIVVRQRLSKHFLAATNTHATTAELFDVLFSTRCLSYLILSMLCKECRRLHRFRLSGG
jgi:hypothetical protein